MVVGHDDEDAEDDRHPEDVPSDRDVVHQRQAAVGEDVHQRVEDHDQEEQEPGFAEDVDVVAEVQPEDVHAVEASSSLRNSAAP